ncbi:MAG TPA: hypothetical protein VJL57_02205 [Candidatus Paceibacterota bacterium]
MWKFSERIARAQNTINYQFRLRDRHEFNQVIAEVVYISERE